MKNGLFWRLFGAILSALTITIILFTAILLASQRTRAQESYETEVRVQARQVAEYMQQLNQLSLVRDNATIQDLVNKKIIEINDRYNADIWLVSFSSGRVQYVDRSWNTTERPASPALLEELSAVQSGKEIRASGLFPELGDHIVTIGVPWTYAGELVVGAVLMHIPIDQLTVGISAVLPQIAVPAGIALLLGIVFAVYVARSQTLPMREIDSAVRAFTKGDMSRRVELNCGGELEQLGHSINRMVAELSNLEQSRRSFVANVSHELRSPMTSIKGYIQAIMDGTIPPEDAPRYLQVVMDETNRLTELVHDLLDLSRLESGKFPMDIKPFDANEMMRRMLIRFEQRIGEKGIDVNVDLAEEPCYVMGDVSRITQVVNNFVDNAVKFMNGENMLLTVRTRREGKFVRFCVQDNGPGISEADQPHILERFYKADKAHTAGMGTGLGLSICKNILMQHESSIEVYSRSGETRFEFLLPAAEPVQRAALEA